MEIDCNSEVISVLEQYRRKLIKLAFAGDGIVKRSSSKDLTTQPVSYHSALDSQPPTVEDVGLKSQKQLLE